MGFTKNLSYLMQRRGYSAYKLAKVLGVSNQAAINWQTGVNIPHTKTRQKIADHFGITLGELDGDFLPVLRGETDDPGIKKETPAHQMVDERLDPNTARLIELYSQLSEKYRELYLQQLETLVLALQDGEREKNTQG